MTGPAEAADFLDAKAKRDAKLRERLRKAEVAYDKANGYAREDGDQTGRKDTGPGPDQPKAESEGRKPNRFAVRTPSEFREPEIPKLVHGLIGFGYLVLVYGG
jgi:hypothetical protein